MFQKFYTGDCQGPKAEINFTVVNDRKNKAFEHHPTWL